MTAAAILTDLFGADASVVATAFSIDTTTLPARMCAGGVASMCGAGVDADLGHFRMTLRHAERSLRLTVNADGKVLTRAIFPGGVAKADRTPPSG